MVTKEKKPQGYDKNYWLSTKKALKYRSAFLGRHFYVVTIYFDSEKKTR